MKKFVSTLVGTSIIATGLAISVAPNALAFTLGSDSVDGITASDIGESFTVQFDGNVDTNDVPGLSSEAVFTLTSFAGGVAGFDVLLSNTSSGGITSRTSVVGFDTNPDISAATASGDFDIAVLGSSLPNQFGSIEVCFKGSGGPSNCQGGGGDGATPGNDIDFSLTLTFASGTTSFDMNNFGVRYQSINGNGFSGDSGTGNGTPVPEPLTILGAGAAISFGTAFKRKLGKAKKNDKKA